MFTSARLCKVHRANNEVFLFGSFTEDEVKSLPKQPAESDLQFTFGSVDFETLRSVGYFNKRRGVNYFRDCSSEQLIKEIAANGCGLRSISPIADTVACWNGILHDSYHINNGDGTKELKYDVELAESIVSDNVSDLLKQSSVHHFKVGRNISPSPLTTQTVKDSSVHANPLKSEESLLKEPNGSVETFTNFLPRGLVNLGNLCFLNATLQALLSCPPFFQLLQELRIHDLPKVDYPTLHGFIQFLSDFCEPIEYRAPNLEMDMVLETGRPLRPVMFESILKNFTPDVPNSTFGRTRQEDAQEFLSFVMHQMHEELLKLEGRIPSINDEKPSSIDDEDDNDDWETVGPKNRTAIIRTQSFVPSKLSAVFGGQLRSVVKAKGSKDSVTIQPFLLLHLNICPEVVCSIEDALHMFSAPETLEGYRTSAGGKAEVVSASKSVKILELSEMMILHLMRFSYGSQGSTKLHKPVSFPLELVLGRDLLVSQSLEGQRYELVATITHHGRDPSKGHYTANGRHPSGMWLHYDDASVTLIPTSHVLHEQAYILFYKKT